MAAEGRVPVLIGAGEVTERLADPASAREPARKFRSGISARTS
jgi:hypothetical protein